MQMHISIHMYHLSYHSFSYLIIHFHLLLFLSLPAFFQSFLESKEWKRKFIQCPIKRMHRLYTNNYLECSISMMVQIKTLRNQRKRNLKRIIVSWKHFQTNVRKLNSNLNIRLSWLQKHIPHNFHQDVYF